METLEAIARRSAEHVRAEAEGVADTEAALRDLRDGVTIATVVPIQREAAARRWWIGAAAATIGLVAVGVAVTSRDEPSEVVPADSVSPPPPTSAGEFSAFLPALTEADAEVLYEATVGDATDQLGVRDELRPLAPFVQTDGAVVIGDPVNNRWVVVRDGVASTVATDPDQFTWDALRGSNGTIYACSSTTGRTRGS